MFGKASKSGTTALLLACLFATLLLAGCSSQKAAPNAAEPQWVDFVDQDGTQQAALLAPGAGLMVGSVIDEEGNPIAGIHVALLGTSQSGSTNNLGAFQFLNLESGRYQLRVDGPGFEALEQPIDVRQLRVTEVRATLVPAAPVEDGVAQARPNTQVVFPLPSQAWMTGSASTLAVLIVAVVAVVLVLRSRNPERIANRAFSHLSEGQLQQAEQLARRAVTRKDTTWTGWFVLGAALIHAGRYEEAISHLERASRKYDPKVAGLAFLITLACHRLGQPERARRWLPLVARDQGYWDALEHDPDTAFVNLTRTKTAPKPARQDPSYG